MSVDLSCCDAPPSPRIRPFIASSGDLVYLWGGEGDTEPETVFLFHRDTETWARLLTRGPHPPAGLNNGGCCISRQHFYICGGNDGRSYPGVIYELDTNSWTWTKLSDGGARGPSNKKEGCRIMAYQDQLLVVGGYSDELPSSRQAGSSYEDGWTNEVHCFNLTTGKRKWLLCEFQCLHELDHITYTFCTTVMINNPTIPVFVPLSCYALKIVHACVE